MNKDTSASKPDESFRIDWKAAPGVEPAADGGDVVLDDESLWTDRSLPAHPPLVWESDGAFDDAYNAEAAYAELDTFFRSGRREPHAVAAAGEDRPAPTPIYELSSVALRTGFPVCCPADAAPVSLSTLVERASEGADEATRHALLRMEVALGAVAKDAPGAPLSVAFDRAEREVADAGGADSAAKARKALIGLGINGPLYPCRPDVLSRLAEAAAAADRVRRAGAGLDELDALIARGEAVLAAGESHSPEALTPEQLRASAGTDDRLDYDVLSKILERSRLSGPMDPGRKARVVEAVDTLRKMRPMFVGGTAPFDTRVIVDNCEAVRDQLVARERAMISFFRAVSIVALEVENRYQEDVHDRLFAQFDASWVEPEQKALFPPVYLHLTPAFVTRNDPSPVLGLLASGSPVKIIVEIDDLAGGPGASTIDTVPSWPASLARMALAFDDVFVHQTPLTHPDRIAGALERGFAWDGAALFSVYTGNEESGRDRLIDAAAAADARVFPAFTCDPAAGTSQCDRVGIEENTQYKRAWPVHTFRFAGASGAPGETPMTFSPAEFFCQDMRFEGEYWNVPAAGWHHKMVPVGDWLERTPTEREGSIPFVTAIGGEGVVHRLVVTRRVIRAVERTASRWRSLQDWAGVGNSFVEREAAAAVARLEEEKRRDIEAIEKKYAADLDRDLGELTRVIVERIASRLIAGDAGALSTSALPPATAAVPANTPVVTEPAGPADVGDSPAPETAKEEDAESFDDAYIDTPLCTSCNDCTGINARIFAYDDNKQAYIRDASSGPYADLVAAAEKCPVHIIHPGQPLDDSEPGLDALLERARPFL